MLGDDFAAKEIDSCLVSAIAILDSTVDGKASAKEVCVRGVVECDRCASRSILRGVIDLGIPITYLGIMQKGIREARRLLDSL